MNNYSDWDNWFATDDPMVPPCRGTYEDEDLTEFFDGRQDLSYADIGSLLGRSHTSAKAGTN